MEFAVALNHLPPVIPLGHTRCLLALVFQRPLASFFPFQGALSCLFVMFQGTLTFFLYAFMSLFLMFQGTLTFFLRTLMGFFLTFQGTFTFFLR